MSTILSTHLSEQKVQETIVHTSNSTVLIRRIERLELHILERETFHATESIKLAQKAFEAARVAKNLTKQLTSSEKLSTKREGLIKEITAEKTKIERELDAAWKEIDALKDANICHRNQKRDLRSRIRSTQERVATLNGKLAVAELALADQAQLTYLIRLTRALSQKVETNVTTSCSSGLITGLFFGIFVNPFCGCAAASAATLATLRHKPSTNAAILLERTEKEIEELTRKLKKDPTAPEWPFALQSPPPSETIT